uniref:Uncharacterized protein n=1 Tax=Micrurus corallinus TaxID=54390 RepID=A0A2D4FIU4_MICCO
MAKQLTFMNFFMNLFRKLQGVIPSLKSYNDVINEILREKQLSKKGVNSQMLLWFKVLYPADLVTLCVFFKKKICCANCFQEAQPEKAASNYFKCIFKNKNQNIALLDDGFNLFIFACYNTIFACYNTIILNVTKVKFTKIIYVRTHLMF